ncbi:MAG: hypothetical protein HZA91_03355 [Verrucomicrobia bacterium]|nr:hypothetical protein [Verrucomicrobiota bacterium]
MKWIVFIPMLAVPLAFAQEPPRYYFQDNRMKPEDALKRKAPYSGKMFDTKAFDTKATAAKPFETKTLSGKQFTTKAAATKGFSTHSNAMTGQSYATTSFEPPKPKSWWQRLFGTKTATESGKTFATTNLPTKMDAKFQEKVEHPKKPGSFKAPTIRPTPENMNKPLGN